MIASFLLINLSSTIRYTLEAHCTCLFEKYGIKCSFVSIKLGVNSGLHVKEGGLVAIRIGRFPVQTLLGARPGLGTQSCYETPDDLRVNTVKRSD